MNICENQILKYNYKRRGRKGLPGDLAQNQKLKPMEILEVKTVITDMKNSATELNSRLDTAEESDVTFKRTRRKCLLTHKASRGGTRKLFLHKQVQELQKQRSGTKV